MPQLPETRKKFYGFAAAGLELKRPNLNNVRRLTPV
jgi:hypothetical protein